MQNIIGQAVWESQIVRCNLQRWEKRQAGSNQVICRIGSGQRGNVSEKTSASVQQGSVSVKPGSMHCLALTRRAYTRVHRSAPWPAASMLRRIRSMLTGASLLLGFKSVPRFCVEFARADTRRHKTPAHSFVTLHLNISDDAESAESLTSHLRGSEDKICLVGLHIPALLPSLAPKTPLKTVSPLGEMTTRYETWKSIKKRCIFESLAHQKPGWQDVK